MMQEFAKSDMLYSSAVPHCPEECSRRGMEETADDGFIQDIDEDDPV